MNLPDFSQLSAPEARELFDQLRAPQDDLPEAETIDTKIDGPSGSVPIRIYRPADGVADAALVWCHGGGWVLGDLDSAELCCRDLANQAGRVVVSVDYRLAPEHPFPAAFDDCLAATEWAVANAEQLGVKRVAIGGDSAGGNLAAAVALAARDAGVPLDAQVLVYPVIEAEFDTPSYIENGDGYLLTTPAMQWFWDQYVPFDEERVDPRVAPLRGTLEGTPPAFVYLCGFDPLRDEGRTYAAALAEAGVEVVSLEHADAIHGVFGMPLTRGAEARRAAGEFLRLQDR